MLVCLSTSWEWVKSKWNAHLHIFACQVVCEVDTLAWALSHVRSSCQIFRLLWIPNSLSVLHTETIKTVRCESESLTCNIIAEIKSGERKFELWLWSNGCRFHYLCHSLFKLFFWLHKIPWGRFRFNMILYSTLSGILSQKPLIRTSIISSFKSH